MGKGASAAFDGRDEAHAHGTREGPVGVEVVLVEVKAEGTPEAVDRERIAATESGRMRARPHSHPCVDCQTPVECCGDIEQNFDGWPPFTCHEYHLDGGSTAPEFRCEDCHNKAEAQAKADLLENV